MNSSDSKFNSWSYLFDGAFLCNMLFLYFIIPDSGSQIVEKLNPVSALILVFIIQFFVTFEFGKAYMKFEKQNTPKFIIKMLNLTLFLVFLFLFTGLPAAFYTFGLFKQDPYMMLAFIGGVVFILLGAALGFSGKGVSVASVLGVIGILFFVTAFIGLIYLLVHFGIDRKQWLYGIGIFLGGFALLIGFFVFAGWLGDVFSAKFSGISTISRVSAIINPLFIAIGASSIAIWQNLQVHAWILFSKLEKGAVDPDFILFSLIFSGILPLRIIIALAPPKNRFPLFTGLLVILVNIYGMLQVSS